jgi:hypothetical protein
MNNYSPFLRFKQGEITALLNLTHIDRDSITPLLEIPRDVSYTEGKLIEKIDRNAKRIKTNFKTSFSFYVDNYEVPDTIRINGKDTYTYLLNKFDDFDIIPVIGLDRTEIHNSIAISYANNKSRKIALRVTPDYFDLFLAYIDNFKKLLNGLDANIFFDLLIDCNYIDDKNVDNYKERINNFLINIIALKKFNKIVIVGSSISEPVSVKTGTNVNITRNEVIVYKFIKSQYPEENLVFGDYTIISPGYSELTIEPKFLLNVMTPKIIYSLLDVHYFTRGKPIKPHGRKQYFEQAKDIINKPFFRGKDYSWGDNFLFEKAMYGGKNIMPSSIIGPTVNAHIKFMINEINKGAL